MKFAEDIASFLARDVPAPEAARRRACEGIADAIGVMLAGRDEAVVASLRAMAADATTADRASLLIDRGHARGIDAALVNATAAHVLAMDDVVGPLHPSATMTPALLAEAEAIDASGAALVDAYVAGFEVMTALVECEPDSLHDGGWHPTGLFGPIGAAAAVARLKRLSADRCLHAIGIAASTTGGLQANFGTPTKALHVGRAANAGLWAARLAERGVTASPDAIDGARGLLRVASPKGRAETARPFVFDPEVSRLMSIGISFKKYPVCYTTHRVVDAAIDLSKRHDLDAARVMRVEVSIGRRQAAMARFGMPRTPFEAKYSVPFVVASGLVARAAGIAQLAPDFIESASIRRLIGATEVTLTDSVQAGEPVFAIADRVVVTMDDGTRLDSGDVAYARGHASAPWSREEHRAKFIDCAGSTGFVDAPRLYEMLMSLDRLERVGTIAG